MEYFTIEKENRYLISCVREIPADPKGIVIAVHGFASSRECATYQMLLQRLPEAGFGMIGIELPGHGTAESSGEPLRIGGCLDSITAAEAYAFQNWSELPVYYFASSFGAYLTGIYISTRSHRGRKAFFRSAAVNMPSLFIKENPTEEERRMLEDLEKKGYFVTGEDLGKPMKVTREMYHDLEETDLFQIYQPVPAGSHKVAMVHGAEDTVIDPAAAVRFAEQFDHDYGGGGTFPGERSVHTSESGGSGHFPVSVMTACIPAD